LFLVVVSCARAGEVPQEEFAKAAVNELQASGHEFVVA